MNLKMKDVKVHVLRLEQPTSSSASSVLGGNGNRFLGILRIISEDGLEGITFVGTRATENLRSIQPLAEDIKPFLVGQDALDRERLWHQMRQMAPKWDVNDPTIMAVDVALWDLAAKSAGIPVYKLLGAYREKILAYASAPKLPGIQANVEQVLDCKEQGIRGYKLHHAVPDLREAVEVCTKVRQAVGDDMALAFDCGGGYSFQEALYVGRALDELAFRWYEDPMGPNDLVSLAELNRRLDTPISISDAREFRFAEASNAINQGAARILIADPKKDGVTGMKKMATLCEAHHLGTQFHHGGNSSMNAAVLNVALSIGNSDFYSMLLPLTDKRLGLVQDLEMDSEGYVHGSDKPGLGVDIDWELVDRYTEAVL